MNSYNHTSTGILICNSLASLQTLAKREDILISAVKQFHSLSSLIIYAYEWQLSHSEQDPYTLNELNTSNSCEYIAKWKGLLAQALNQSK